MVNFHEDILRHIFRYLETPLDWIQVSQVCHLWEETARKEWTKITEINYLDVDIKEKAQDTLQHGENNVPVISAKEAVRIIHYAAPSIKILSGEAYFRGKKKLIMFGQFLYKVQGFKTDMILKLLTQKATKITEISFDRPPRAPLLKLLFEANNIRKVEFKVLEPFYLHVETNKVEELVVRLDGIKNAKSFEGHFPNLMKLDLTVDCKISIEPEKILSRILPNVVRLKSFDLHLAASKSIEMSENCMLDIAKLAELEKLSIEFGAIYVSSFDTFFNKLEAGCPKLREIIIKGYDFTEVELCTLLVLPCLEFLKVERWVTSFRSMKLTRMSELTRLEMDCLLMGLSITSFCNALKMMPKLENLLLDFFVGEFSPTFVDKRMKLILQIATVVVSQKKNFVVMNREHKHPPKLRIAQKATDSSDTGNKTLTLAISLIKIDAYFIKSMQSFVRENCNSSWVVTVES